MQDFFHQPYRHCFGKKQRTGYLDRFSYIYLDGGLIPDQVFQLREKKTGLCLQLGTFWNRWNLRVPSPRATRDPRNKALFSGVGGIWGVPLDSHDEKDLVKSWNVWESCGILHKAFGNRQSWMMFWDLYDMIYVFIYIDYSRIVQGSQLQKGLRLRFASIQPRAPRTKWSDHLVVSKRWTKISC